MTLLIRRSLSNFEANDAEPNDTVDEIRRSLYRSLVAEPAAPVVGFVVRTVFWSVAGC